MPLGLKNAPAVFERLMQRVLMGLNPPEGPDFVMVYIDDILLFSSTLEEHLQYIQLVLQPLREAGLKHKPKKFHFICREVEYLGHIITRDGLKTNPTLVASTLEFPRPTNLQRLRQFLGLSLFHRRFVPNFANLTRKVIKFVWDTTCQSTLDSLKQAYRSTILSFPSFDRPFVFETDASKLGLGNILSQGGRRHPVGYASRSLYPPEQNNALAVV